MLAPNPDPPTNGAEPTVDLTQSAEVEDVRATLRATLKKIKSKKTTRLNEDSRLFRLKQKLTEVATADDVERRRRFLEDHADEADAINGAATGSGVSRIPDAIPDA